MARDRGPRHRAEPGESCRAIPDRGIDPLVDTVSSGSPGLVDPESTSRFGFPETVPVSLPALRAEQLRHLASRRGVSTTALVARWIIERLELEDPGLGLAPSVPAPTVPATAPERLHGSPAAPASTPVSDQVPRAAPQRQPRVPPPSIGPLGPTPPERAEVSARGSVTPLFPGGAISPGPGEGVAPGQPRHRAPEPITRLDERRRR